MSAEPSQPSHLGFAAAMVLAIRDGVMTPLVEAANEVVFVAAGLEDPVLRQMDLGMQRD